MPNLFTALDTDWAVFSSSSAGNAALRRWRHQTAIGFDDLAALLRALRSRSNPDARDRLLRDVIYLAARDLDARRVVLQALIPGLIGVARRYAPRWGQDEVESMVVAAALDRIANYPLNRSRPAANIVRDVQNDLYRARRREVDLETAIGEAIPLHELHSSPPIPFFQPPSDELVELVADRVGSGAISTRGARLILLHRVLGVRTQDIARAEGCRPCTVRKHRQQAEVALGGVEVA